MEARELRIGNLLTVFGDAVIVTGLSSTEERPDMYWVHTSEYIPTKIFHFKPIPLTEQWLIDFGFTPCSCGGFKKESFHLDKDFIYGKKLKIRFVHILQNVYFYIEQKEIL